MVALISEEQKAEVLKGPSYSRMKEPVILLFGDDEVPESKAFVNAAPFMAQLARCGRNGVPIRMIAQGGDVLTDDSLTELNLFLRYGRGMHNFPSDWPLTAWAWSEFQEFLNLRWRPITLR